MTDKMTLEKAREIVAKGDADFVAGNCMDVFTYQRAKGFLDGHAQAEEALKNQDHSSRCAMSRRLIETLKEKNKRIKRIIADNEEWQPQMAGRDAEIARLKPGHIVEPTHTIHSCNQKVIDRLNGDVARYKTAWETECEVRRGYRDEIEQLSAELSFKISTVALLHKELEKSQAAGVDGVLKALRASDKALADEREKFDTAVKDFRRWKEGYFKELAEERVRCEKLTGAIKKAHGEAALAVFGIALSRPAEAEPSDRYSLNLQKAEIHAKVAEVILRSHLPTPAKGHGADADDFHDRFMGGGT